jgi:hypothetical protein
MARSAAAIRKILMNLGATRLDVAGKCSDGISGLGLATIISPEVLWFANGRPATRGEVQHSIDTGLHLLQAEAERESPDAVRELERRIVDIQQYLPA